MSRRRDYIKFCKAHNKDFIKQYNPLIYYIYEGDRDMKNILGMEESPGSLYRTLFHLQNCGFIHPDKMDVISAYLWEFHPHNIRNKPRRNLCKIKPVAVFVAYRDGDSVRTGWSAVHPKKDTFVKAIGLRKAIKRAQSPRECRCVNPWWLLTPFMNFQKNVQTLLPRQDTCNHAITS